MGTTESESIMGYIELYNIDNDGGWTDLNDIPFIETINCQLCNEPTEARDIVANIVIKDAQPSVGAWQCRKCHAVNG
jgi:hypothetical protein